MWQAPFRKVKGTTLIEVTAYKRIFLLSSAEKPRKNYQVTCSGFGVPLKLTERLKLEEIGSSATMSWLRSAMNKAAEVGGKNNITRAVKNYAGTVVHHAGQAVAEGAKIFQDRMSVRNLNSFKLAVRRLEEVAFSARGAERVQALGRWLVALKDIEKMSKSATQKGERNYEQAPVSEEDSASPRKAALVLFYDPESGAEPMNFRDVFLRSQALENIAVSMILEAPTDDEVSLLLEMFGLCLVGGKEVHDAVVSSIQDLAKVFASYQEEVLVKRDELLQFARVAVTGLKINAEMSSRIDAEVLDLQQQVVENNLLNMGEDGLINAPESISEEKLPESLKKSQEAVQVCSRLHLLLQRKKDLLHSGDSEETHAQKVNKLRILAESLASSTTKAEKRIADNRHQKEEALDYQVVKAKEVAEIEKELAAEIEGLEKRRAELETELKNVNAALATVNARCINTREEREQFNEASTQIVAHLKTKEEELMRSVAIGKTEANVVSTWINFLEDTWLLQSSHIQQKEKGVKDALEESNTQFLQLVLANLSTFKEDLRLLLEQIKTNVKDLQDLSNKRSQLGRQTDSEGSKLLQQKREVEENFLKAESQASTIFNTVESMKEEFQAHQRSSFRNAKMEDKATEAFGVIDQIRQEFEAIQRPALQLETLPEKEDIESSEVKLSENVTDDTQLSHSKGNTQPSRSFQEDEIGVKSSGGFLDAEAELAKLESEFGKTGEDYSSQEIGGWEFEELEEELRSSSVSRDT